MSLTEKKTYEQHNVDARHNQPCRSAEQHLTNQAGSKSARLSGHPHAVNATAATPTPTTTCKITFMRV